MARKFKELELEQLDEALKGYIKLGPVVRPKRGWVRSIRRALGMSAEQLAKRVGLSRSTVAAMERYEAESRITLESMEKLARGMGCRVDYVIVPEKAKSFTDLIRQRAEIVAREQLARVSHTMKLEDQGISEQREKKQLTRLVDDLLAGSWRKLWQ